MDRLHIGQVEAAINRARRELPASGHEASLAKEVALLADIYGLMIYTRQHEIALLELDPVHREAMLRWSTSGD